MSEFARTQSPAAQPDSTPVIADPTTTTRLGRLDSWAPGISVATIWLATLAAALFSPDLITGSQHEHFPLIGALDWLWAAVATGYVLMARQPGDPTRTRSGAGGFLLTVATVWATTAVASVFGPPLITGTDPTQIPLVALLVPLAAMAVTGFICLHAAKRPDVRVPKHVGTS